MASKALRGLTIEIGGDTTELNKALDNVDKRTRSLSSELGQINKALKLDPSNIELLAQKQKVLAEAISSTEEKLDTLKEAEKQVQKQFEKGEVSEEQVRALRREIIETERKLDGYKNAAKETAAAEQKLADGAEDAAEELAEQTKKTKDAEDASEDLDDSANSLAMGGLAALAAAATAAVTAIVALAEESREYRVAMGKLDTAFKDSNLSAEAATETYEALQSVLGETDQAVEASSLLAKLCNTEEELAQWTDILTGVYGVFGASLPVEGLAEAANETMRVGQVTGPLADALNWAAKEGETFGVKMKEATEANEEWNKAVEEAASAEDFFNLALQECSNEQERQQLITKTLTKLYGSAATQYKKTNREVIRANQATEKWNKTTAKIGKTVEPVVTDIKELGTVLLEDASEPLEDIAMYIRKDVLPAIERVSKWTKANLPTIKGALVGVATAMVAFKVATIATTVAQKGLKNALKATAVAQKALNLVQAATPLGLITTALVGVTAAMFAYSAAMNKAKKPAYELTEEEKALKAAADEAAQAFRDQKKATDEALGQVTATMKHTQDLALELFNLADASGKVKDKDEARAQFILNELNDALGTEYKMVDGIIQKYDELSGSIAEVIQQKTANALLEAANAEYISALQNETEAWDGVKISQKDYEAQLAVTQQKEAIYAKAREDWQQAMASGDHYAIEAANLRMLEALGLWEDEQDILNEKETAYNEASDTYNQLQETILNYEKAQGDALSGNYQTAVDLFTRKGQLYVDHNETVDEETAKTIATLEKEAYDAGEKAKLVKENFEKGVAGYTAEMVAEAEQSYKDALGKFATAYNDAYGLGEDFGQGLADGIKIKDGAVGAAAIASIRNAVKAAKKEAEINSPSKKTMVIGEGLGEGTEVGIEEKTEDIKKAAAKQMASVMDAYGSPEVNAQKVYRNVAEQQSARQLSGQQAVVSATGPMLEKILSAIKEGKILTIDGDALVGATANKMDNALGRRRALASRGAI